ncbi:MAG: hypothetical protein ACRD1R_14670 [Acidobacteriota bacterium]
MRNPTTQQDNVPAAVLERLERDKREWDHWRKTRGKRERIPERLWQIALSYQGELSLHRISREFRLEYNKLKRLSAQEARLPKEWPKGQPSGVPQFIDLTTWLPTSDPRLLAAERPGPSCTVVFERADGNRLRIEGALPEVGYMQALVGIFYRG